MNGKIDSNLLGGYALDGPGGSNIKSIQRLTINIPSGAQYTDTLITGVDLTKSIIIVSAYQSVNDNSPYHIATAAYFINATTVRVTRSSAASGVIITAKVQIIEFNNVKSLQSGTLVVSSFPLTQTITSVNMNKAVLFFSFTSQDTGGDAFSMMLWGELTNATTLTFSGNGYQTAYWFVIEFN